ncbi:MAG TPA: glycine oxidase ThiO [Longimicrobiales bacterium]|nr:glycine oxidase ThiO [Longimicrobiales bacterium]
MSTRVAIVGGGAIGCSIAWRLARRGASVRVIDDQVVAGAATRAAGGMLAPLAESHKAGPFLQLALESLRRYPDFVAELEAAAGIAVGYVRAGKVVAALSAAEEDDLASMHAWQSTTAGARTEWLSGEEARALEPALAPQVRAAVLITDDHRVDNVALGAALERAATLAGVDWIRKRASRLLEAGGRALGVETSDGERIEADVVVVAAGAWSGELEGLPRALPIRPVRGQMLALRPERPLFGRTIAGTRGYLVPRLDGRVIVGSTMEEAGFESKTTPDALAALRAGAVRLIPALAEAARAGAWAGLRPATPDGLPVLGPDPSMPGLSYATGHFRNGILLAPITADALAADILGDDADVDLTPWSAGRFEPSPTGTMEAGRAIDARDPANGGAADAAAADRLCDLCGSPMYEVHCKLICPSCGYKRDCTDLW